MTFLYGQFPMSSNYQVQIQWIALLGNFVRACDLSVILYTTVYYHIPVHTLPRAGWPTDLFSSILCQSGGPSA